VWHAIVKGWLRHLDRNQIDLQVFYTESIQDEETLFARSRASHFEQGKKDFTEWVKLILGRQLDVLIYPEIGMDPMTVKLASLRLAPKQMAAWGHPLTTGLPSIDYYLSAEDFEPEAAQQHYTERLIALPHLGCCYYSQPVTALSPDLAALGIDADLPLLVCPGASFKYSPRHDRIFPEIAKRLARCQLVFFTLEPRYLTEMLKQRLKRVFADAGLDFEKYVVFIPKQPRPKFHGLLRRADVFLDTLGFSGFNTAMQALECGLPMVTHKGRFMRGRFGSGILQRMGLPELTTSSEDDYIQLAVKLVEDVDLRQSMSARIVASRSALYEDLGPVKMLQEFLLNIVSH
jgi:predicted O-linked N-acetylglucosamine transferase (SPINDLY family)